MTGDTHLPAIQPPNIEEPHKRLERERKQGEIRIAIMFSAALVSVLIALYMMFTGRLK